MYGANAMFNISGIFDNSFDVVCYTLSAMRETGYSNDEMDEYLERVVSGNNYFLIKESSKTLKDCNELYDSLIGADEWFDNTWDQYYYTIDDEDEGEYCDNLWGRKERNIWEDDNAVDDVEDAYEGFDCCPNHKFTCYGYGE